MDYGICLPNFPDGASREGMEAAAETAERLRATDPANVSALAGRFAGEVAPLV